MHVRKETYDFYLQFRSDDDPESISVIKDEIDDWLNFRGLWNPELDRRENVLNFCSDSTRKLELKHIIKKISRYSIPKEPSNQTTTTTINLF